MIAGTIVFAVSYGIALSVAMIDDFKDQTSWLAIPIAGPWLMMYNRSRPDCDSQIRQRLRRASLETILRFYLAIDGVAQAAGVGLLGFGMAGRKLLVRDDSYASVRLVPAPSARPATARCWPADSERGARNHHQPSRLVVARTHAELFRADCFRDARSSVIEAGEGRVELGLAVGGERLGREAGERAVPVRGRGRQRGDAGDVRAPLGATGP